MKNLSPVIRISLGLVLITCSILVSLDLFGLAPKLEDEKLEARIRLCETLAAQAASAAARDDFASIRAALEVAVRRNEDVLSGGVRTATGLIVATGNHRQLWEPNPEKRTPSSHVAIPLFRSGKRWATIEVRFEEFGSGGFIASLWANPFARLLVPVAAAAFVAYVVYMRRTLRHLDPSAVIPARVQAALDVMAEGVILLDEQGRIILANTAFGELVDRPSAALLGVKGSRFDWRNPIIGGEAQNLPWVEAMRASETVKGVPLQLVREDGELVSVVATGAPVLDGEGRAKGTIATFDDVTELERKSAELERKSAELEKTQEEIRLRNEELEILANHDSLSGLSNRRFFLEESEVRFESVLRKGGALSCIMLDIDHFKQVNDAHGHHAGDEVIRRVAELMKAEVCEEDGVCRYGGEEFCILLNDTEIGDAAIAADRLRRRIAAPAFARVPVTASLGVTSMTSNAKSLHELIRQADDALYASKAAGRNRVTRWDEIEAVGI